MTTRPLWYRVVFVAGDVPGRPPEGAANTPQTASARGYWQRDRAGRKFRPIASRGLRRRWEAVFVDPASVLTDAKIADVNREPQEQW